MQKSNALLLEVFQKLSSEADRVQYLPAARHALTQYQAELRLVALQLAALGLKYAGSDVGKWRDALGP